MSLSKTGPQKIQRGNGFFFFFLGGGGEVKNTKKEGKSLKQDGCMVNRIQPILHPRTNFYGCQLFILTPPTPKKLSSIKKKILSLAICILVNTWFLYSGVYLHYQLYLNCFSALTAKSGTRLKLRHVPFLTCSIILSI